MGSRGSPLELEGESAERILDGGWVDEDDCCFALVRRKLRASSSATLSGIMAANLSISAIEASEKKMVSLEF